MKMMMPGLMLKGTENVTSVYHTMDVNRGQAGEDCIVCKVREEQMERMFKKR